MEQPHGIPEAPKTMAPFGDWFGEVFRVWSAQWKVWALYALALNLAPIIVGLLAMTVFPRVGWFAYSVVQILAFALFMPGMVIMALKQMRGQAISTDDIFVGMNFFSSALLVALAMFSGALLCGVGAIFTVGLFWIAMPALVDRMLPPGDALRYSWRVATQNALLYILFALVMGFLSSAGVTACCIGLIFTSPWYPIAMAVAYERTAHPAPLAAQPPIAPSNPGGPTAV